MDQDHQWGKGIPMPKHIPKHDRTYRGGRDVGKITCPRCECTVLYNQHSPTRPKYCPDCEHDLKRRFALEKNMTMDEVEDEYGEMLERELRMEQPRIILKTIQQIIDDKPQVVT